MGLTTLGERHYLPDVPNKRRAGMVFLGGWVPKAWKDSLKEVAARETGGNLALAAKHLIEEALAGREETQKRPKKKAAKRVG
jgi:hypothetical protein